MNLLHARTIVQSLLQGGVRHAVLSPGSRSTPLVVAMAEAQHTSQLTCHIVLDERCAAFLALGLCRASATPVALVCTSGSAPGHYTPAIMEAFHARLPLIVLTADRPAELQHCGAPQATHQHHLFPHHTRFSAQLPRPLNTTTQNASRTLTARALRTAQASPPGPVHLNVPFAKPLLESHETHVPQPAQTTLPTPAFHTNTVCTPHPHLIDVLSSASRGVIVCGPRPTPFHTPEHHFAAALTQVAARLNWPILHDVTSGLRFGTHPNTHLITTADALLRQPDLAHKLAPDCILRFGQIPTSKPITEWLKQHAPQAHNIHVDPDGFAANPNHAHATLLHTPPTPFLKSLLQTPELRHNNSTVWLEHWKSLEQLARPHLDHACAQGGWEGAIAMAVAHALPLHSTLHLASSMPIRDMDSFAPHIPHPIRVFSNRGVNGIDGTLATAIGEAHTQPQHPTVLLCGDLAFLHDANALSLATSLHDASLTVVLVDNAGGGIFGFLPIAQHPTFDPFFTTPQKTDIRALTRAYNARYHTAEPNPKDIASTLRRTLPQSGIDVLHIRTERAHNIQSHNNAFERVGRAL